MRIGAVNNSFSFTRKNTVSENKDNNPISKSGEKAKLVKATFVAGLGVGAKLLFELMDGDFVVDKLGDSADKIVEKQHRNVSRNKKGWLKLGAAAGLIMAFIGGFAMLYTLFKAPKINYDGNVNAFQKELYTQMNDKAKKADKEEKAKLKEQYMQMKMVKNRVPDFVKLNR